MEKGHKKEEEQQGYPPYGQSQYGGSQQSGHNSTLDSLGSFFKK